MAGELPGNAQDRLDGLSRMLVSVEASKEATMSRIAELACGLVDGCDYVSITVIERDRPETVGATDERAIDVDAAQYRSGSGPCLDAITNQRVVRVPSLPGSASQFGERVVQAAVEAGIGSSISAPLLIDGTCLGGLNVYSTKVDAFDDVAEEALRSFAQRAAAVAANARDYWAMVETTHQLEAALQSRAVIEQAKGMLMARQGCSADEAFDILRRASQRNNRKLRDIAMDIVTGRTPSQGDDA